MKVRCRHCKVRLKCRPRGLCHTCFYDLSIREMYEPQFNIYADHNNRSKPTTPTKHLPGTSGKILVLINRAKKGEELFCKSDDIRDLS